MNSDTQVIGQAELRQILLDDIGIDEELLAEAPDCCLGDLGVDSIAQVELTVVLRDRFGITAIPDDVSEMSVHELAVCLGIPGE
jgi:acyl carrier protein